MVGEVWVNIAIVAGAIIVALLLHYVLFRFLQKSRIFHEREKVLMFWQQLYSPARVLMVLLSIFIVYRTVDAFTLPVSSTIRHLLSIVFILVVAWLTIKLIRAGRIILMRQYDLQSADNLAARKAYTQIYMIENILHFLVGVLTIGIILMTFPQVREVGVSLLTSAGIAGIILGFAAQKLIATILAGIQIALTQPFRIDDVVIVEREWGRIEEINLTYVVVKIWDERRLVVPTIYFIENPFQNWTRTSAEILGTVYILTDYRFPVSALRQEQTRLLQTTDLWDKRVNVLQVTDAKEKTMELRVLVSASDASSAWDLRVFLREKLIEFIQKNYPESLPLTRVEMNDPSGKKEDKAKKPGPVNF
ncbi:MAG: mechanosensitive ion channel domain-containing protein [Bacteroidia bacterium]